MSQKIHPTKPTRSMSTSSTSSMLEDKHTTSWTSKASQLAQASANNRVLTYLSLVVNHLLQDISTYQILFCGMATILIIITGSLSRFPAIEYGGQSWKVFLFGAVIMVPIIFDACIEFFFQFHIKRDHQWLLQLSLQLLPNCIILLGIIAMKHAGLVLFLQYLYYIMMQFYQIQRLSSFTKLVYLDITIYSVLLFTLAILGTVYHLSQVDVASNELATMLTFYAMLVVLIVFMVRTCIQWMNEIAEKSSIFYHVASARIVFLLHLLMFGMLAMLPGLHFVLLLGDLKLFLPENCENNVILEIFLMVYFVTSFALRTYEMRMTLSNMKLELDRNRKLSRSISHEIRTPLNTAFMAIELLQDSMKIPTPSAATPPSNVSVQYDTVGEWLETVGNVREACELALNILNQLLTFDKLSSKMLQLERKLVSTMQIVDSNSKLFRMQAIQGGITFRVDLSGDERHYFHDIYLYVDDHKLNQVIRNLLSNAMKFTPKGGVVQVKLELDLHRQHSMQTSSLKLRAAKSQQKANTDSMASLVRRRTFDYLTSLRTTDADNTSNSILPLRAKRAPKSKATRRGSLLFPAATTAVAGARSIGTLKISIIDSGPGVSEEDQAKLFQEYVQISPGELQKGQGSGLGLSISKSIIALHGGKIGMLSDGKGKGSTFFVELPAYRKVSNSLDTEMLLNKLDAIHDHEDEQSTATSKIFSTGDDYSYFPPANSPGNSPARTQRKRSTSEDTPRTDSGMRSPSSREIVVAVRKSTELAASSRKLTMLVVDDSMANRKMLTRLLARDGHSIVEANDGVQAINIIYHLQRKKDDSYRTGDIEQGITTQPAMALENPHLIPEPPIEIADIRQVDVVLMDNFMIEMNGPEAAKLMRSFGFKGPILGVTGSLDDAAARFLSCGADAILQKPIDVKGIWKTLHSIKYFSGEYSSSK